MQGMIFGLIGGLGLFLFGMQIMGEGLQKAAGDRMRSILETLTRNPITGILVGAGVTAVIQSSSATTVMVVGFVNAGLMGLRQAVGIILGANIGTTITAQLVAFHLTDYALPAIGLGFALGFLGRTKTQKYTGQILLGFGILFLGMAIMSDAVKPLKSLPQVTQIILSFGNRPVIGLIAGAALTGVIQSSSVTTGLVVTLANQGLMDLTSALPVILGANIGTTVTAMLASIGTSVTARRAAVAHLLFNVGGSLVFLPFLQPFSSLIRTTSPLVAREVANAHTLFNIINTLIALPILNKFIAAVIKLVPGEELQIDFGSKFLDDRLLQSPAIALSQAKKETIRMGHLAMENLDYSIKSFFSNKRIDLNRLIQTEEVIDKLDETITVYLAELSQKSLTLEQSKMVASLLHVINDLERVGDHAETISELGEYKMDHRLPFSEEAMNELREMYNMVKSTLVKSIESLEAWNIEEAKSVAKMDDLIDRKEKELRVRHIARLNEGKCYPASGVLYLDLISNLERVGDHAVNVADAVLGRIG